LLLDFFFAGHEIEEYKPGDQRDDTAYYCNFDWFGSHQRISG
jgi:hypothetical protein